MRKSFRLFTSTILGAVFLLSVGVGSTMARGQIEEYDLSDAWCFQDVAELYCNVQTGTFTIETKKNGVVIGRVNMVLKTEVTADGAFVARYRTTTRQVTRTNPDGTYSFTSRERTRWTDGDETCITDVRLKIVDFEVIVDSIRSTCR